MKRANNDFTSTLLKLFLLNFKLSDITPALQNVDSANPEDVREYLEVKYK